MIKIIFTFTILLLPLFSLGQRCTYAKGMNASSLRSIRSYTIPVTENDRTGLVQVIDKIKDVIQMEADFDIYQYDKKNCEAQKQGRKLFFDVQFLQWANSKSGTRWAAISILAHEIGHHISGFRGTDHKMELDADYWSGYILQKLGSRKDAATKAMNVIGDEQDSESHPNKYSRIEAIQEGWEDGASGTPDFRHGGR